MGQLTTNFIKNTIDDYLNELKKNDEECNKENLEKLKTEYENLCNNCAIVNSEDALDNFTAILNYIASLEGEKPNLILKLLNNSDLKQNYELMWDHISDYYSILVTLKKICPKLNSIRWLDIGEETIIYGASVNTVKYTPYSKEKVLKLFDYLLQNDMYSDLARYFKEILLFDEDRIAAKELYKGNEITYLKKYVNNLIKENQEVDKAVLNALSKNSDISYTAVINATIRLCKENSKLKNENKILKENIDSLEEKNRTLNDQYKNKSNDYSEMFTQWTETKANLVKQEFQCNSLEKEKNELNRKYNAQVGINESQQIAHAKQLEAINEAYITEKNNRVSLEQELIQLESKAKDLENELSNYQADLATRNVELQSSKDNVESKMQENESKIMNHICEKVAPVLRSLVKNVEILKNIQGAEKICKRLDNNIRKLEEMLADYSIKKIANLDDEIIFDESLYMSEDAYIANGEKAIVKTFGFINEKTKEVIIKSMVKKVEA